MSESERGASEELGTGTRELPFTKEAEVRPRLWRLAAGRLGNSTPAISARAAAPISFEGEVGKDAREEHGGEVAVGAGREVGQHHGGQLLGGAREHGARTMEAAMVVA